MMLQACLNGARAADTPGLPLTPDAVAGDARASRAAGAACLHIHPRDAMGRESLAPPDVAAHLSAVRTAVPGMAVGISTGDWILPHAGRLEDMHGWTVLPDYVSVNLEEADAPEVLALMGRLGIGVELGLAAGADLDRLLSLPATLWHGAVRIMIEMNAGTLDRAMPVARRILDRLRQEAPDLPILLHGFDATAWDFVAAARDLGCDARIGLEDCLYLPDGRVAGNGALVAAAARTLGLDA